jgi:hypothetical protein
MAVSGAQQVYPVDLHKRLKEGNVLIGMILQGGGTLF